MSRGVATQWCWGLGRAVVVSVAVAAVMASGVGASGCAVGQYPGYKSNNNPDVEFDPADAAAEFFDGSEEHALTDFTLDVTKSGMTLISKIMFTAYNSWGFFFYFKGANNYEIKFSDRGSDIFYFEFKQSTVKCSTGTTAPRITLNVWHDVVFRWRSSDNTVHILASDNSNDIYSILHNPSHSQRYSTTCANSVTTYTYNNNAIAEATKFDGKVAGMYVYNEYLSDEEVYEVVRTINIEAADDTCTQCPSYSSTMAANATDVNDCQCMTGSYLDLTGQIPVCQACPPSTTTLGAGKSSIEDCACQTGSWSPVENSLIVHDDKTFNRDNKDNTTFGTLTWNIATNGGFTIITRAKFTGSQGSYERIFASGNQLNANNDDIQLLRHDTEDHLYIWLGQGGNRCRKTDIDIAQNTWYNITWRYSTASNNMILELNNQAPITVDCQTQVFTDRTNQYNFLGRPTYNGNAYLNGEIAGFYAWDRYLSDAEAEAVLATIKTSALDDPLHTACVGCAAGTTTLAANSTSSSDCVCESGSFGPHDPLDGLVALFGFDGDAEDEIGDASIHAYSGPVSFVSDGTRGQVLDNGAGKLAIDSVALADVLDQDTWTISLWIKQTSFTKHAILFQRFDRSAVNGKRGGISMYILTNNVVQITRYASDTIGQTISKSLPSPKTNWHHISLVSSPNKLELYLNGQLEGSKTLSSDKYWSSTLSTTTKKIGMGVFCLDAETDSPSCTTETSAVHHGYRQDLRFYNRALTPAEIATLANRTGSQANVCGNCPAATPYTDPLQAAEAEGDCEAVTGSCEVLDVQFSPEPSEAGNVTSGMVKYAVFDVDSTITFPASPTTTVDVLVISHSFYRYVTNLEKVSGQYTITVAAAAGEDSGFVGASGPGVTSGGGVQILGEWILGAVGETCDATCATSGLHCDPDAMIEVNSKTIIDNLALDEFEHTCVDGGGGRSYAGTPFINALDKCYWWDYSVGQNLPAPVCNSNDVTTHRPICRCKQRVENAITGTLETYTTPQVVVQYHAIACGDDDSSGPACPTIADPSVQSDSRPQCGGRVGLVIEVKNMPDDDTTSPYTWNKAFSAATAAGGRIPTTTELQQWIASTGGYVDASLFDEYVPTTDATTSDGGNWVQVLSTNARLGQDAETRWTTNVNKDILYTETFGLRTQSFVGLYAIVYNCTGNFVQNNVTAAKAQYITFPATLSPYTVTFPEATTGEVLVVSDTEFAYDSSIDLPAGSYTVTVGAGESRVVDGDGGVVAGSVGGTEYVIPQNLVRKCGANEDQPCGVIGSSEADDKHLFECIVSDCVLCESCEASGWHGGGGLDEWVRIDLGKTFVVTKISIRPPWHGGQWSWASRVDGIQVHIGDTDSVNGQSYTANNSICGQVQVDWDYSAGAHQNIIIEGPFIVECNLEGRYVDLQWLENDGTWKQAGPVAVFGYDPSVIGSSPMILYSGIASDITGAKQNYTTPQVILRYNTTVCPAADGGGDTPSFEPTGNVTFLLAKGNVTVGDITTTLQSTIKADIATALGITEADRVFIDHIKASPRRDKEVNMVVHVEHGATDRDTIAGKTADVATAVKTTLNENNLNVCGCNAASLVNSEVQMSINC